MKSKTVRGVMVIITIATVGFGTVGCGQILPTTQEQAKPVQQVTTQESSVTKQTALPGQQESNNSASSTVNSTIPADNKNQSSTTASSVKTKSTSQQTSKSQTSSNQMDVSLLTKKRFNQLQYDDTYEHISLLIGKSASIISEEGTKGSKDYTITYRYKGNGGTGSQVILVFKANKLLHKVGLDLK